MVSIERNLLLIILYVLNCRMKLKSKLDGEWIKGNLHSTYIKSIACNYHDYRDNDDY
jgi:hypothetical protein